VAIALALAGAVPAHGTVAATPAARPLSRIRIAFTQNYNVYIMNADGSGRVTVTTDGAPTQYPSYGPDSGYYSWYEWSSDGRYLSAAPREQTGADLLLVDAQGKVLRVLAHALSGLWGKPTWAVDETE